MTTTEVAVPVSDDDLIRTLQASLYPGAQRQSVELVLAYCRAAKLDPLQKPVHIVPMRVKTGRKNRNGDDEYEFRDVIMPGVGSYRTAAARTGQHAGTSEPHFGPTIAGKWGTVTVEYPEWCKVIVKRAVSAGVIAEYVAIERWTENYASKSGGAPNAMWARRPFAQLAKCAEAQALRRAFPELGASPTADEMEGKVYEEISSAPVSGENEFMPKAPAPALEDAPAPAAPYTLTVDGDKVRVTPSSPRDAQWSPEEREELNASNAPPLQMNMIGGQPPAAATATVATVATVADATTTNLPPATDGMKRMVRGKLTDAKSEDAMRAVFGFGVDDMPAPTVNKVLAWLKEAA